MKRKKEKRKLVSILETISNETLCTKDNVILNNIEEEQSNNNVRNNHGEQNMHPEIICLKSNVLKFRGDENNEQSLATLTLRVTSQY